MFGLRRRTSKGCPARPASASSASSPASVTPGPAHGVRLDVMHAGRRSFFFTRSLARSLARPLRCVRQPKSPDPGRRISTFQAARHGRSPWKCATLSTSPPPPPPGAATTPTMAMTAAVSARVDARVTGVWDRLGRARLRADDVHVTLAALDGGAHRGCRGGCDNHGPFTRPGTRRRRRRSASDQRHSGLWP